MSALWYQFVDAVCLKVSGKDARRYLHNRLSHDVRALAAGESLVAAALNPQGRVEGLFAVFLDANESFFLVCDGGVSQTIFSAVGRFIVADRVSIEDISSRVAWLHISMLPQEVERVIGSVEETAIFVRKNSRLSFEGSDVLVVGERAPALIAGATATWGPPLPRAKYELQRCLWGMPAFPSEVNDQVILTECGLRDAVSFSKGCYVGQEVIERSDAIGKLPRTLERIVFSGAWNGLPGSPIQLVSGEAIGKVVSMFPDEEGGQTYVFALLRSGKYSTGDTVECCGVAGKILTAEQGEI